MERLFTIGAYGFDSAGFFHALQKAEVDIFLDLRRRRGMRGGLYSFANATRLQSELDSLGIAYRHVIELAPDSMTRDIQREEDARDKVAKRQRSTLSEGFVADYTLKTLGPFDWEGWIEELKPFRRPVLFCVERDPEACHRRLVSAHVSTAAGLLVTDLMP